MLKIPNFKFEKSCVPQNCRYILGIDEVGRGCLAGPIHVGAFLLDIQNFDRKFFIKNKICDSKMLSPKLREQAFKNIENKNYPYIVVSAQSSEIDSIGIQKTIYSLIEKAVKSFENQFDFVLVDGNIKLDFLKSYRSVVSADAKCFSVAAASICAKVVRDKEMIQLHELYPEFGFKNNKGYGTKDHLSALQKHGPCPLHRRSYAPIKNIINK